jgi:hypothetical protein
MIVSGLLQCATVTCGQGTSCSRKTTAVHPRSTTAPLTSGNIHGFNDRLVGA